ncbi:MAG: hypothetical protein JWO31_3865, partial [Phycisphaerales bacterium]|nr:hypothetical protein [Phycisphaerales bacterium]
QPARAVAAWATGRGNGSAATADDRRPADAVVQENQDLRLTNAKLSYDLAELQKVAMERGKIDPELRNLCTPVAVLGGADPNGVRDALSLRATGLSGFTDGMFVLHDRDVVGRLVTGKAGARVRLVTDPESRVQAYFVPFRRDARQAAVGAAPRPANEQDRRPADAYNLPSRLVEGAGRGRMVCRNIPFDLVTQVGLTVGDWVMVNDPEWPPALQGRRLGVVVRVTKAAKMMAEIEIKPDPELLLLREVLVLTKEK